MSGTIARTALSLALATLAGSACRQDAGVASTRPSGLLVVSLDTPHADDGAVLVSLSGGGDLAPVALDPAVRLFVLPGDPASRETRVAVIGTDLTGPLFGFQTRGDGAWDARILDAADTRNRTRSDLHGYVVRVAPDESTIAGRR